ATRVLDLRGGRALALPGNYSETAAARAARRERPEPAMGSRTAVEQAAPPAEPARPEEPRRPPRKADPEDREAARRRRKLRALEEKIAALEAEVAGIDRRLDEEALTLGPVAANNLSRDRRSKKEELDQLVEEWAALSEHDSPPVAPRKP